MKKLFTSTALAATAVLTFAASVASAQAQSGSVAVGSATIAYRVQGHGPAMMLVHGFPLSGELFSKNRAALARRYTVVTPDLRGFGNSTTPDTKGGVQLYAKDMLAVMDHLHVRKAIIGGMSMGGPVVLEMYREAPQRFRGMILIDSTSSPANDVEKAQWPGFGQQARDKGVASMIPVLMPQRLPTAPRRGDPALVQFLGGRSDLPSRDEPEDAPGHARLASGCGSGRSACGDHREAGSLQPSDCRLGRKRQVDRHQVQVDRHQVKRY